MTRSSWRFFRKLGPGPSVGLSSALCLSSAYEQPGPWRKLLCARVRHEPWERSLQVPPNHVKASGRMVYDTWRMNGWTTFPQTPLLGEISVIQFPRNFLVNLGREKNPFN